ncbi:DUF5995 family protein [Dactylosporangium sucinum]|nr:DUF5995 family protein [Dactylosporangium sucinum]
MEESVARIVRRMEHSLGRLDAGDARRFFHETYLRTTLAVAAEIDRGGFADGPWLERWDVVFAELYLDAFDARLAGAPVPGPWRVAFDTARDRPGLPPLRHVLLGMNAHINYDLPQSLVAVISSAEFDDPAALRRREADHRHVDAVLLNRVGAEDVQMRSVSTVRRRDRLLGPLNRAATKRVLREARAKVWRNAAVLDRARRDGTTEAVLGRLDQACTAKLMELTAPGQVMLRLARRGFGVTV